LIRAMLFIFFFDVWLTWPLRSMFALFPMFDLPGTWNRSFLYMLVVLVV
jgi:hypothetical protein